MRPFYIEIIILYAFMGTEKKEKEKIFVSFFSLLGVTIYY